MRVWSGRLKVDSVTGGQSHVEPGEGRVELDGGVPDEIQSGNHLKRGGLLWSGSPYEGARRNLKGRWGRGWIGYETRSH